MKSFTRRPDVRLRRYIDRFWGWESEGAEQIALPTLLSGTGADLFFHYRTPFSATIGGEAIRLPASHLVCVRRTPVHLATASSVGFVAVRFRVGGVHRFIAAPAAELLDSTLSAGELWPGAGPQLEAQFGEAESLFLRVGLIERFLLSLWDDLPEDELAAAAARRLYRDYRSGSIDGIAAGYGLSRRQLERRIKAWTGQSPGEIRNFSRLQKTVRDLALNPDLSVLDAALEHGYYDQAHFINAFRQAGCGSPRRFREAGGLVTHFYNHPATPPRII